MNYGLFIDWENLWIEHIGRSFPSYSTAHSREHVKRLRTRWQRHRRTAPPRLDDFPELLHLPPAALEEIARFPDKLLTMCTRIYGAPPQFRVATAVWQRLPLNTDANIEAKLKELKFHVSQPTLDIARTAPRHLDDASDYKLTLDLFRSLFVARSSRRSTKEKAQLKAAVPFDAVVLVTGDFIFTQLIDFLTDTVGLDVHLLTFQHSLSGPLHEKMSTLRFRGRLQLIESQVE